ncbi:MAG: Uncharacterized protein Athens071425_76 [Parcubacteria group bacterium Athens0714_25]|nr:MAG: Uncharacterized protein Athens071425_76 [Parcubacteria group bacterium Athens0714_25]
MQFQIPKDNDKYQWTAHSVMKMRQYGLSAQRVLRVVRAPHRKEEGIVKKTVAVMQPVSFKTDKEGKRTWGSEIWVMYQLRRGVKAMTNNQFLRPRRTSLGLAISKQTQNSKLNIFNSASQKIRIISAWKYPGVSPKNNPVPEDILRELEELDDVV